jgi:predicted alpha/beta-hydrolase family hydrolase
MSTMNACQDLTALATEELRGLKHQLRLAAVRQYGDIRPVASRRTLDDCYNVVRIRDRRELVFWFNAVGGSTHIVRTPLAS